jgi:transcriptional repressor NrdR
MKCPFCGHDDQIVLNTRDTHKGTSVWRRRRCTKCFEIYTTYENIRLNYINVIKRSGKKVRFSRAKLFAGIYHATYNNKGFDNGEAAILSEDVTCEIENYLVNKQIQEISTEDLSDIVTGILKKKDPKVAINYYIYFKKPKGIREIKRFVN